MGKFSPAVGGERDGVKGRDAGMAGAWGAALTFSATPGVQRSPAGLGTSRVPIQVAAVPRAQQGAGELPCDPAGSPAAPRAGWWSRGAAPVPPAGPRSHLGEAGACWLPERGLPRECSGPVPRIWRWVFVCCCAPEVWCYCDRKRERRGEGGWPAGDVPVKSLCPCRALSCEFPQRGESRLCAAEGLPTCESPGPGGWRCEPWGWCLLGAEGRQGPLPCRCARGGDPCSRTHRSGALGAP